MSVSRKLTFSLAGVLLAAGGLGTGLALGSDTPASAPATAASGVTGTTANPPTWMTSYAAYSAMISRYGGTIGSGGTGAGPGGMMGRWTGTGMMGGGYGAYSGTGMGQVMGRVLANASGPRVSTARAAADATAVPPGASVDAAHNRLTLTGNTLTLVAGTNEKNMYTFEAAGLTNPEIVIPVGAHVTLRLINADTDMAHGIVITTTGAADTSWMPMMTSTAAFPGAAIWALGEATDSGAPTATTSFTAVTPGTYTYLCPIPGHTQQGMYGTLTVR